MRVSIIGTGYVGLVTGACLAEKGHEVICVDLDRSKVDQIMAGASPIYEPGLSEILQRNVGSRLTATTDLREAVANSELSLIAVGTPFDGKKKDLSFIEEAARQIGRALRSLDRYHVVVVKSTVPPGTTDDLVLPVLESESGKAAGRDFGVGMNPEFLREGEAIGDFMNPDRLVFGAIDDRTLGALEELYAAFPDVDRVRVSNRTAELCKYASNALFAMLISFSNEIGKLCSVTEGVDVVDVLHSVHLDRRVSPILDDGRRLRPGLVSYLGAGCGYGGSCFPKDVQGLVAHARSAGVSMPLMEAVVRTNDEQPAQMLQLLRKRFDSLEGVRVAVLGLAFKPGTDDMRESPAIPIIRGLRSEGALVSAYDPEALETARSYFDDDGVRLCAGLEEALDGADSVFLVTRWPEFDRVPGLLADRASAPVVVDGRRMLAKDSVPRYEGIGL
jgi:UDPglucose 6-dehydrogenase/GDP-mannose 6-dehydrogenase